MSRLQYFSNRFSLFLVSFIVLTLLALNQLDTLNNYADILLLVTPVSLALSAWVAGQFGQGRLALMCILFGLTCVNAHFFDFSYLSSIHHLTGVSLLLAWLSWRSDSALVSRTFLFSLIEIFGIGLMFLLFVDSLQTYSQGFATPLHTYFFNLSPQVSGRFAPFEALFYLTTLLPISVKLCWRPNHSHTLLLLGWIATVLVAYQPSAIWVLSLSCLLAAFIIIAIISYSFAMAYKDELTAIPSRRALMQYINGLGRHYVVVMADIDHFKKFNDTHGHDVGDQVLKLVAQKLNSVSGGGRAFRYGGEEFTLIFAGKSADEAKPFVELLRASIESYAITLRAADRPKQPPKKPQKSKAKAKQVNVTCSFGIAQRDNEHNSFESVIKLADNALYAAKKAGRNCVMLAKQ